MSVETEFWRGKRVFITGHTGFKGSWLSLWLALMGARLTGFSLARPVSTPCLFDVAKVGEAVDSHFGDVQDAELVRATMAAARPEILFHMAAQPLVRRSYREPVETFATNVMGTVHVLDAVRAVSSVRAVVNVTSDKCYENREWVWAYREDDGLGGRDPYSSSKACAELVSTAYARSYFSSPAARTAVASVRAGNVIGGGDWAEDRLVPDIMRAFMGHRTAIIRNPGAVRPWQHVLDPLAGYLLVARGLWSDPATSGERWNFGPTEDGAQTVEQVAAGLAVLWGPGADWRVAVDDHARPEAGLLKLDSAKARANLFWRPRLALPAALEWTASWYRSFALGDDMRAFTEAQIRDYCS